jgi:PHD/YefM family antitoxin component YafN of YafNO toxin-antitoxin module
MLQWAEENNDEVVIERRGKPAGVIIAYEEYKEVMRLREQERRRKVFARMEAIRKQVAEHNPDLSAEEAYRLAGFSELVSVNGSLQSKSMRLCKRFLR